MPLGHFMRVHKHDPTGAAETAMLLVTDPRWQAASHRLIEAIVATGLVADDHVDLLARAFVAAGPKVYWTCSRDWFDGPSIALDLAGADLVEFVGEADADDDADDRPVVVARAVPVGVRRWAAERVVRHDPAVWGPVLQRARAVGGADGGAIVRGILDAVDVLTEGAARLVRTEGLRWGRADVRLAVLELLADDDAELARVLASQDPNEKIRRWASRRTDRRRAGAAVKAGATTPEAQPALF